MIMPGALCAASRRILPCSLLTIGVSPPESRERADGVQGPFERQQALARTAHPVGSRRSQTGEECAVPCHGLVHPQHRALQPKAAARRR